MGTGGFMQYFVDELINDLTKSNGDSLIKNKLINLGSNARLKFEIGICEDELTKLGFKPYVNHLFIWSNDDQYYGNLVDKSITIHFKDKKVCCSDKEFYYENPNWRNELLNFVRNNC